MTELSQHRNAPVRGLTPRRTLIAVMTVAVVTIAAGCFGNGAERAPKPHPHATHVVVAYRADGSLVHRHLGCTPPAGDYPDPAAGCAALRDLQRAALAPPPRAACGCIVQVHRPGSVVGELDGRPVWLPLGADDPRAARDVETLPASP